MNTFQHLQDFMTAKGFRYGVDERDNFLFYTRTVEIYYGEDDSLVCYMYSRADCAMMPEWSINGKDYSTWEELKELLEEHL